MKPRSRLVLVAVALAATCGALALWLLSEPDEPTTSGAPASPRLAARIHLESAGDGPLLGFMRPVAAAPFQQSFMEEQVRVQRCLESIGLKDEDRQTTLRVHDDLRSLTAGLPQAAEVAAAAESWGLSGLESQWSLSEIASGAEQDREYMDQWINSRTNGSNEDHSLDHLRLEFLESTGRVPEAVELAKQSYQAKPGPGTGYDLAYAHSVADDWAQARAVSESALARADDPRDRTWLNYQLAAACSQLGDEACVEGAIGRLTQDQSEPSLVPFAKGFSAGSRYHHADAISSFSEAWEQNQDFATAFNIGLANMCMGRPQEARDWFVQAKDQRLSPRQTTAVLAGVAYTHLDDGDGASAWLLGASALSAGGGDANSVEPRIVLALAALAQRDLEEARWQMKEAVRADPSPALLRGRCFARRAEEEALRALEAEQRGHGAAAQAAWRAVATMPSPAFASVARRALAQACLKPDPSRRLAGQ